MEFRQKWLFSFIYSISHTFIEFQILLQFTVAFYSHIYKRNNSEENNTLQIKDYFNQFTFSKKMNEKNNRSVLGLSLCLFLVYFCLSLSITGAIQNINNFYKTHFGFCKTPQFSLWWSTHFFPCNFTYDFLYL